MPIQLRSRVDSFLTRSQRYQVVEDKFRCGEAWHLAAAQDGHLRGHYSGGGGDGLRGVRRLDVAE
jgi:hypothetical protein